MDFFKREVNEGGGEDVKLVGAVVPTNIFYYFNLFCVVDKRSKSSIIRPLVEEWYKEAVNNFPENKLLKLAATMGYDNYKQRKKKRPFVLVIKQQERELRKKGVSEEHIKYILERIEQAKRKDDSETKIERVIKRNKKIKKAYEKNNKDKK